MASKYHIGQVVTLNRKSVRLPVSIKTKANCSQKRQVVGAYYDRGTRHTHYHLGYNGRGVDLSIHDFRANELKPYRMKLHTKRLQSKNRRGIVS
jgi:hypothetical protein